jgi:hypothetical protein
LRFYLQFLLHLSDLPTVPSAAKKLAYDQAWAVCKAKMDKAGVPGSLQANERYIRGSNCMKRYGYRI